MKPTISIIYKFTDAPWGGGNQFLKALRKYLIKQGVYEETPQKADIILFNSHHELNKVFHLKLKYPSKVFIHRLGSVFRIIRNNKNLDRLIYQFNEVIADASIFQSLWSAEKHQELIRANNYERIILNASDPDIFNRKSSNQLHNGKIRLIASSWASDLKWRFQVYQYLDEYLDFNKYEMTFVGNSPVEFKNIKWIKPVPSVELANILNEHDIYIAPSINDTCSNSLIEALSCGLPAVAMHAGGHEQILKQQGEYFINIDEIIPSIEKVAQNYTHYQHLVEPPHIEHTGDQYYQLAQHIYDDYMHSKYKPKHISIFNIINPRSPKPELIKWLTLGHFLYYKQHTASQLRKVWNSRIHV